VRRVGHDGDGFAFDNERPRHRQFVASYRLASRPVTNGEYLAFLADGGYDRPELWLADGWDARRTGGWAAPLYWEPRADGWWTMTLAGIERLDEAEPVCHVSFYEADAFARWADARLPTEAEWEHAAADVPVAGNFLECGRLHPAPAPALGTAPTQLFGDVWEWTQSPYTPYPGYRPAPGALGEYNGKFMCNQMVLRGGSCATPRSHIRPTYRNFFPPPPAGSSPGSAWPTTSPRRPEGEDLPPAHPGEKVVGCVQRPVRGSAPEVVRFTHSTKDKGFEGFGISRGGRGCADGAPGGPKRPAARGTPPAGGP
jgi:ergothioneine biosynthesis protein EgtB